MHAIQSGACLIGIFSLCSFYLYLLSYYAPEISYEGKKDFGFPSNLNELKSLAKLMRLYYDEHWAYVVCLFSSAYIYKQSFMIPGSVFLNILGGALFGVYIALPLCCVLTGIGATCSYFLSKTLGKNIIEHLWINKMKNLKEKVLENKDNLFFYLLFLRLFPMTPNWLVNLLSPLIGIPLQVFFPTVTIGLIPYNYTCVQAGDILASLTSVNDIFTYHTLLRLSMIALASLGPAYYFNKIKKKQS